MRKLTAREAADIGRKGGQSGRGAKKRRSKAHYKRLVAIRRANATKRRLAANSEYI
jgi:hypothetical protein